MTKVEGISCLIIIAPMMVAALGVLYLALDSWFQRYRWWQWYQEHTFGTIDVDDIDAAIHGGCVVLGTVMILLPVIVVYSYTWYIGVPIEEYIVTTWQQVRIVI